MIGPATWQPADGLLLEPNALRAAIEQGRNLALTAGPGAGKTEMLAQRADFLLRTGQCRYPKRILAICFKADASKNLKARVNQRCGQQLASRLDSYTFHGFAKRIIDRFRVLLTGLDALDADYQIGPNKVTHKVILFADLIPLATEILKVSAIARRVVRQTYTDVFLDEFQDCTAAQYAFVKLAFHGTSNRLTAVGDTKQKIMGWAGAVDGIFGTFATDFNAIPLNMYRNFRSQPRLLRMQNEIIKVLDAASVMKDDQLAGDGGEISIWNYKTAEDEASGLAAAISEWIEKDKVPPTEIAVLFSKQPELYAPLLMQALTNKGVRYRNEQTLQDLSTEPVAKLIADYLACISGMREPAAWMRLMSQLTPFADEDMRADTRQKLQRLIADRRKQVKVMNDLVGETTSGWWDNVKPLIQMVGIETIVALSPDYESRFRIQIPTQGSHQRDPEAPRGAHRRRTRHAQGAR